MNNKVYWLIGGIIVIIGIVLVSRWTHAKRKGTIRQLTDK